MINANHSTFYSKYGISYTLYQMPTSISSVHSIFNADTVIGASINTNKLHDTINAFCRYYPNLRFLDIMTTNVVWTDTQCFSKSLYGLNIIFNDIDNSFVLRNMLSRFTMPNLKYLALQFLKSPKPLSDYDSIAISIHPAVLSQGNLNSVRCIGMMGAGTLTFDAPSLLNQTVIDAQSFITPSTKTFTPIDLRNAFPNLISYCSNNSQFMKCTNDTLASACIPGLYLGNVPTSAIDTSITKDTVNNLMGSDFYRDDTFYIKRE